MTTPPPTTTTPTLAQCIQFVRGDIALANPKFTELRVMYATLDYLLAHESALRREAVLREALREYDETFTEFDAESGPSRNRMRLAVVRARKALADSGSGG